MYPEDMTTLSVSLSPTNPAPGSTVTATYSLSGAPADHDITIGGNATFDGAPLTATGTLHLTHSKSFQAPTGPPGMTFSPTADPMVWTATAPAS